MSRLIPCNSWNRLVHLHRLRQLPELHRSLALAFWVSYAAALGSLVYMQGEIDIEMMV